jgi:hypothetical protein
VGYYWSPITEHFQFFQKSFFESNFCSRFIKDSIKGTTKNVKKSNKSQIAIKKRKKFQKNDFWGLCPGLNCLKKDPK